MSEIQVPQGDPKRQLTRAVAEWLAGTNPVTGLLTSIYRVTHPSELDQMIDQWRKDISAKVIDNAAAIRRLEDLLRPRLQMSELAVAVGVWLARNSPDGLPHETTEVDDLASEFPDEAPSTVRESVTELEDMDFVKWSKALSGNGFVNPTYKLFFSFDGPALGYRTLDDAVTIAETVLSMEQGCITAESVEESLGWERRRFNPALAKVLTYIDPMRVSKEIQAEYPAKRFLLMDEDRFRIRRFKSRPDQ